MGITTEVSLVNPNVGDMAFDQYGRRIILTDLASETAQRLWVRLQFFKGEWFNDLDAGTPYFQHILVKDPKPVMINAIFRKVIEETQGVDRLNYFTYEIEKATREMTISFQATLTNGQVFRSEDFGRFYVALPGAS